MKKEKNLQFFATNKTPNESAVICQVIAKILHPHEVQIY